MDQRGKQKFARRAALAIALAVSIAVPLGAAAALAGEGGPNMVFKSKTALTGDSERPSAVDTGGSGDAKVGLKMKGDEVQWLMVKVMVCNISNVTMAHIHAPAGDNATAGIALLLYGPDADFSTGECKQLMKFKLSGDELSEMLNNMDVDAFIEALTTGNAYLNVHTEANPAGEIRGQLE